MELRTEEMLHNEEYRVQVTTKKAVVELIKKYKEVLKNVLDGQSSVAEEARQLLLQELLMNFETAVQENVLVNGQPWDDTPDSDEAEALDNVLDETIVKTSRRRRKYPQQILPHVVRSLKAQRTLLGLYEQAVKPQELGKDPVQESIMSSLSAAAPGMVKQAIQAIKSIQTLQQQTEGLCQVLNMKPGPTSVEIYKEVFGFTVQSDASLSPLGGASRSRQPRAIEDAEAINCYMPPNKKTKCPADTQLSHSDG